MFAIHIGEVCGESSWVDGAWRARVLEIVDVDEATAGPGQIRIRNYAAAVNPTDVVARDGTRAKLQSRFPALRARYDVAGIVDQVGDGDKPV